MCIDDDGRALGAGIAPRASLGTVLSTELRARIDSHWSRVDSVFVRTGSSREIKLLYRTRPYTVCTDRRLGRNFRSVVDLGSSASAPTAPARRGGGMRARRRAGWALASLLLLCLCLAGITSSVDAANVKASRRSAARAANEGVRPVSSDVSLDLNDNHATPSRGVSLPSSPSDPIASSNAGPDADTPGEREATRRAVVRGRRERVGAAVHRGRARGRRRRAEARR